MEWIKCEECKGTGELLYDVPVPMSESVSSGFIDSEWGDCDVCDGKGEVEKEEDE
tara:strand:+ start:416 stop:580 length:165 start_codon:yes stop_codon:yes gene_type:complete